MERSTDCQVPEECAQFDRPVFLSTPAGVIPRSGCDRKAAEKSAGNRYISIFEHYFTGTFYKKRAAGRGNPRSDVRKKESPLYLRNKLPEGSERSAYVPGSAFNSGRSDLRH